MIIQIISNKADEIIDGIVQGYDASLPVATEETVVGSVWLVERVASLVVLDKVTAEYLELWANKDQDVLFAGRAPECHVEITTFIGDDVEDTIQKIGEALR